MALNLFTPWSKSNRNTVEDKITGISQRFLRLNFAKGTEQAVLPFIHTWYLCLCGEEGAANQRIVDLARDRGK
jgi:hypothetical protein